LTNSQNVSIDQGVGSKADAAALKFCYVDMTGETDIQQVIRSIQKQKLRNFGNRIILILQSFILRNRLPYTPAKPVGKRGSRKVIGKKDIWEFSDNIKRNQYNDLLVNEYKGKDPYT
jgi:hypothetical protein